jgi:hypothetical protein
LNPAFLRLGYIILPFSQNINGQYPQIPKEKKVNYARANAFSERQRDAQRPRYAPRPLLFVGGENEKETSNQVD